MKQTKLLLLLAVILSSVMGGCKKGVEDAPNKNTLTDSEIIEKYTTVPKGLDPALTKIANKIKEQNDTKPFIINLGNKVGLPLWDKAQIKPKKKNTNAAIETVGDDETITVIVPLSAPNTQEVDGFFSLRGKYYYSNSCRI
ncbi:MAG: hypothetical protein NTZ59_14600 [Bacteroidetes bacterium]|nr:hypothetical protein [Bacteroidota bacterium]